MKLFSGIMAAGAVGLSLALTAAAWALSSGDDFSIDETCGTPVAGSPCSESAFAGVIPNIDRVNFTYTARIEQSNDDGEIILLDGDPFTEKGFANWGAYVNDADSALASKLNSAGDGYQVYMVFSATGTAAFDGVGITATFSTFTIEIWLSDDLDTALALPATNAGSVTNGGFAIGSGSGVNADDKLLATATLMSAGQAVLLGGLAKGDYAVELTDFGLAAFGPSFLTDPDPFYSFMHLAGNTGNVAPPGNLFKAFNSVATGDGQLFFTIPEPGTLGLLGGGLLGAAALLRRRKAAKAA